MKPSSRPQRLGLKTHLRVFGVLLLAQAVFHWVGYQQLGRWVFGTNLWLQNTLLMRFVHLGWFIVISTPILYSFVIVQLTRERRLALKLWQLAHNDLLTGIANRRMFLDELNQALHTARQHDDSVAVCFIDLDGFKAINDDFGHDTGDYVLTVVADRFQSVVGDEGIAARLGGDEFALLFPRVRDLTSLDTLCTELLRQAAAPIVLPAGGANVSLSASIGLALYPNQASDTSSLLRIADDAMYEAKHNGRNNYVIREARVVAGTERR